MFLWERVVGEWYYMTAEAWLRRENMSKVPVLWLEHFVCKEGASIRVCVCATGHSLHENMTLGLLSNGENRKISSEKLATKRCLRPNHNAIPPRELLVPFYWVRTYPVCKNTHYWRRWRNTRYSDVFGYRRLASRVIWLIHMRPIGPGKFRALSVPFIAKILLASAKANLCGQPRVLITGQKHSASV